MARLSLKDRIARDVRIANEWFFGGGRERYERTARDARLFPSTQGGDALARPVNGISALGGVAKPNEQKRKG
jgi:hypothetical protein